MNEWTYKDLEHWPELCQTGQFQSPINIVTENVTSTKFEPFCFKEYSNKHKFTFMNSGYTAELNLNEEDENKPSFTGGGLDGEYILHNIHFHWPSEHTLDDVRYPLEVHIVNYNKKFEDVASALKDDGVAVLGIFGDTENHLHSNVFSLLSSEISKISNEVSKPIELPNRIKVSELIPDECGKFYRYSGSLTTPSCTEGVTWTVFHKPIHICNAQRNCFLSIRTEGDEPLEENCRPQQSLEGRTVFMNEE